MGINPHISYFDINLDIKCTVELNEKYYEACKKRLEKMDDEKPKKCPLCDGYPIDKEPGTTNYRR